MKRVAVFLAVVLAGCATTPEQKAQQAAAEDAECRSWGLQPEDGRYAQCRALLMQRQAQTDEAFRKAALAIVTPSGAAPPPVWQPPQRLQTMCSTSSVGGSNFTHCY